MKTKTETTPFIHLQDREPCGTAECGCRLQYDDDGNAQFFRCQLHIAAQELLEVARLLLIELKGELPLELRSTHPAVVKAKAAIAKSEETQ